MNAAILMHPMTNPAARAVQPRRGHRTGLAGGLALFLAWAALAGSFAYDVARAPGGPAAREVRATTGPATLALARPAAPCAATP
jgi:hypothetical protein